MNVLQGLRMRQIALAAKAARRVSPAVSALRRIPGVDGVLGQVMGYRRPFPTLEAAQAAVIEYEGGGHVHPDNAANHMEGAEQARPGDYAALFHLARLLPQLRRVADIGGNVGNLFYCFEHYLSFPDDFTWQVLDLPKHRDRGTALARERGARRLSFTTDWVDLDGAGLAIASGSLHYFAKPLPELLRTMAVPPPYVLINRTPLTDGKAFATVQEAQSFRVACMVYNRADLLRGFAASGYELVDEWENPELSLLVPGFREHDVAAYRGMLLRAVKAAPEALT